MTEESIQTKKIEFIAYETVPVDRDVRLRWSLVSHRACSRPHLLTLTNLIGVNLAGVATSVLQGVRPNRWWEARRAKRATAWALAIWTVMLLALAAVIVWGGI